MASLHCSSSRLAIKRDASQTQRHHPWLCHLHALPGTTTLRHRLQLRSSQLRAFNVHAATQQAATTSQSTPSRSEQAAPASWWQQLVYGLLRASAVAALALTLVLGRSGAAEAARSAGRMGGSSFGGGRSSGSFSRGSSFGGGSFGAASSFGGASRSVGASAFGGAGSSFGSSAFGAPSRSTTHIHVGSPLGFFTPSYGVVSTYSASSALFNLMLLGFVAFVAVQVAQSFFNNGSYGGAASTGAAPVTLVRLQVGCLGMAKQLKRDLDSLAERADTSSQAGLHFMLQEAVLSLLRNPDYCVYADSGSKALSDPDQAEERFQALSLRERSKFKEETLVNVGGKKRSKAMTQGSDGVNELTVVTILVAAEASLQLPKVRTSADLREALSILGGLGAGQVLAVELMWTPQADNDYYTRDELINDYPNMVPL